MVTRRNNCVQLMNRVLLKLATFPSGGSKGEGRSQHAPPRAKISLISGGFSENILNILGWYPLRQVLDLPLTFPIIHCPNEVMNFISHLSFSRYAFLSDYLTDLKLHRRK